MLHQTNEIRAEQSWREGTMRHTMGRPVLGRLLARLGTRSSGQTARSRDNFHLAA